MGIELNGGLEPGELNVGRVPALQSGDRRRFRIHICVVVALVSCFVSSQQRRSTRKSVIANAWLYQREVAT